MTPVQVMRDPFARCTIMREIVRTDKGCAWCGGNRFGRLFRYGVERDSLRPRVDWQPEAFCNIECMRDYYMDFYRP